MTWNQNGKQWINGINHYTPGKLPTSFNINGKVFPATALYEAIDATTLNWPARAGQSLNINPTGSTPLTIGTGSDPTFTSTGLHYDRLGAKFDFSKTYMSPDASYLSIGTGSSLIAEAYFKVTEPAGVSDALFGRYSLNSSGWILRIGTTGKFRFSNEAGATFQSTSSYTDNTWHHAILVYVRNGISYMVLDGGVVSGSEIQQFNTITYGTDNSSTPFEIGGFDGSGSTGNGHILSKQTVARAMIWIGASGALGQPNRDDVLTMASNRYNMIIK